MKNHLITLLGGLGFATFATAAIQTNYVDLDAFTDFSVSGGTEEEARTIFESELARNGRLTSLVGDERVLELTFTDIDMAGEIEPWRHPSYSDIRFVKSIYPPRMTFSYVLRDSDGEEIASGEEKIRDLAFDFGITSIGHRQTFHYELTMLEDWARINLPRGVSK